MRWAFRPDYHDVSEAETWYSPDHADTDWTQVRGEGGWQDQGFADFAGLAWYRARVRIPASFGKIGRMMLLLEGVDGDFYVYLNGNNTFTRTLASTGLSQDAFGRRAFAYDATGWLRAGQDNLIAIWVRSPIKRGGIIKPVRIIAAPAAMDVRPLMKLLKGKRQ